VAEKLNQLQSFVYVILFCLNNHDAANKFIYITASCVYFIIANVKMLQETQRVLQDSEPQSCTQAVGTCEEPRHHIIHSKKTKRVFSFRRKTPTVFYSEFIDQ